MRRVPDRLPVRILAGVRRDVLRLATAESAPLYLAIVDELARLRRAHEARPTHTDLARLVAEAMGESWPGDAACDAALDQLVAWGALVRTLDHQLVRDYTHNRRERFRYLLEDDAAALLRWLESRLDAAGRRAGAATNLLQDLAGIFAELSRLLRGLDPALAGDPAHAEARRRAPWLLRRAERLATDIDDDLADLRQGMLLFATRPFAREDYRRLEERLGRYIAWYLRPLATLRAAGAEQLDRLRRPKALAALAALAAAHRAELAELDPEGGTGPSAEPAAVLEALDRFLAEEGPLEEACRRVNAAAAEVVRRLHAEVGERARRTAVLADLRARQAELLALPAGADAQAAAWGERLAGLVLLRLDGHAWHGEGRQPAPLPPRRARESGPSRPAALAPPHGPVVAERELRRRRHDQVAAWLRQRVLAGGTAASLVQLQDSTDPLAGPDEQRRWLDACRIGWLGQGRELAERHLSLSRRPGRAALAGAMELDAPDAELAEVPVA
jgi:hypothetical protein